MQTLRDSRRWVPAFAGRAGSVLMALVIGTFRVPRRWVPAFAGTTGSVLMAVAIRTFHFPRRWVPAFAGTTSSVLMATAISTLLVGCGFQLRGSATLPFKTIWVGFSDASPLGTEFKRYIRGGTSTKLVTDAADAEARLNVLSESRDREILSVDATGQVREYTLYYIFVFRVDDGKGRDFIGPTRITLKRDITVNNNTILAKQAEEELLYRDMQSDLVQQLLRRLAAVKLDAPA